MSMTRVPQFSPALVCTLLAAGALTLVACAQNDYRRPREPSRPPRLVPVDSTVIDGVLRGGMMGIGGESTGWQLEPGGDQPAVEIDVTAVAARAGTLSGQRVRVIGRSTTRQYIERGPTRVIVAEFIDPVR